jgi:hypothetical protein
MDRRRHSRSCKILRRLNDHNNMPTALAALTARDQQLSIAVSIENVASNITEPTLNFNSGSDNLLSASRWR